MTVDPKSFDDKAILESTKQVAGKKGTVQFSIMLPSGRKLESAPTKMSTDVLISWCSEVRAQIQADNRATEAERVEKRKERKAQEDAAKADKEETAATGMVKTEGGILAPGKVIPLSAAAKSPLDMLKDQLNTRNVEMEQLEQSYKAVVDRMAECKESIEKLEAGIEAMGG